MASFSDASALASKTTVAVAVRHGRGSRRAVSWVSEHLGPLSCRIVLVHVIPPISFIPSPSGEMIPVEKMEKDVVAMYKHDTNRRVVESLDPLKRLFGRRKVEILVLEGHDPATALIRYVSDNCIRNLVVGASSSRYSCLGRIINQADVASAVLEKTPNHCNVIVVSRRRLKMKIPKLDTPTGSDNCTEVQLISHRAFSESERKWILREQFLHSFLGGNIQKYAASSLSASSSMCTDQNSRSEVPRIIYANTTQSFGAEDEVLKLKTDLQTTLAMYERACEDLVQAKKKIQSLSIECSQETKKVQDALQREAALKCLIEMKTSHSEDSNLEVEAQKQLMQETVDRYQAEISANQASLDKSNVVNAFLARGNRCRRYSKVEIEEATDNFSAAKKIGEGSYGNVYRCTLDHKEVAIKVLKQDSKERMEEFLLEVEILSQLHHPNLVLLLGFCPENGTLIYEYMENGSLDNHLLYQNDKQVQPLPWLVRFRIVLEVARGLAFLHRTKPEPIVHRDLKPGNILLDQNYTSKIGDVGLAKLLCDVVPDGLTEYKETVLVGTLYYMDPEYQRTGTIRPKSDLYALGVITLQLLTGRHPHGLLMSMERAVENGSLAALFDRSVPDCPVEAAERLAKLALQCSQLRCRDRPDLEDEFLPEMEEIMRIANGAGAYELERSNMQVVPRHFICPIMNEMMEDPYLAGDGHTYEYRAITAWLEKSDISPVTKQKLQHTSIIPNISLRSALQEWKLSG
ncbi:U-box domain-containing protein kinase family protein [Rhynchospora pubera]|uniref:U-box domain-containing protein kinase family protein n=1 Tax=Rhynchospora pubera TaxID=906938 RepID=A0AAV8DP79_9POAL|nr:U-box domain-containing protein kinase family protein [Rhynchospora pubera]